MNEVATWLNQQHVNLLTVGATVVMLLAAFIIIAMVNRLVQRWLLYLKPKAHWSYDTTIFIVRLVTGALWVVTVVIILDFWGVSVGGVWTLLVSTITLIGVGFLATWTMISNFTASFFLTLWQPFRLGQTVEILPENLKGRVIDRNLMFTTLREDRGSLIQAPNNLFFQKFFRVVGAAEVPSRTSFEIHEGAPSASASPK